MFYLREVMSLFFLSDLVLFLYLSKLSGWFLFGVCYVSIVGVFFLFSVGFRFVWVFCYFVFFIYSF